MALLLCSMLPMHGAVAGPARTEAVRSITLERQCFGCPTASRLELRGDGTALLTELGNARRGTEDRSARGSIAVSDFEALLRVARSQGFFQLEDRYEAAGLQDGAWAVLHIVADGTDKQVFQREGAGPAALQQVQAAIEALQQRIRFVPLPP